MLPFSVNLKRGEPAHEQILRAVQEALASGQLRDGDAFPSARDLSQDLRVSPTTAQKVVTKLKEDGFLAQQSGSGLLVRAAPSDAGASRGEIELMTVVDHPANTSYPTLPFLRPAGQADIEGLIDGYEVKRLIARGGMGMVFEALDPTLMRRVAIKVLAPEFATSADARTRFLREARAVATVDHENVLPVHAVGEANGFPYLVMPLVDGESLQARLRRDGQLPLDEFHRIASGIARGLAAAHQRGLVHRDIKPDNILLETSGGRRVWIADFGLARAVEDESLTRTGTVAGTPLYSSPEQAEGLEIDSHSDLFSFGSLMYAMATGGPPFQAESALAVLRKIIDEAPRPPREIRADLPQSLEDLILQLLQKDPRDRPASAAEIANQLPLIPHE